MQLTPKPAICSKCEHLLENDQVTCRHCGEVNPNAIAIHY